MAVLLALLSAATYGVGDFFGGMASKRAPAAAVLLWSHATGLTLILPATLVVAGEATTHDLLVGGAGGLCGALGVGLLYRALAISTMSAVAPVTALLAAAVPIVAAFAQGERPGGIALTGMAIALGAIVLVSAEGGGSLRPSDVRGFALALGSGFGFGLFFVALSYTDDGAGLWPIVGARMASVGAVGALALAGRTASRIPAGSPRVLAAGAGVLDTLANVLFLLAIREGLLSIVSVLSALYPVSTVILARVVLDERYAALQRIGIVLAIPATVLMAV